jgi:hypothetical protein
MAAMNREVRALERDPGPRPKNHQQGDEVVSDSLNDTGTQKLDAAMGVLKLFPSRKGSNLPSRRTGTLTLGNHGVMVLERAEKELDKPMNAQINSARTGRSISEHPGNLKAHAAE